MPALETPDAALWTFASECLTLAGVLAEASSRLEFLSTSIRGSVGQHCLDALGWKALPLSDNQLTHSANSVAITTLAPRLKRKMVDTQCVKKPCDDTGIEYKEPLCNQKRLQKGLPHYFENSADVAMSVCSDASTSLPVPTHVFAQASQILQKDGHALAESKINSERLHETCKGIKDWKTPSAESAKSAANSGSGKVSHKSKVNFSVDASAFHRPHSTRSSSNVSEDVVSQDNSAEINVGTHRQESDALLWPIWQGVVTPTVSDQSSMQVTLAVAEVKTVKGAIDKVFANQSTIVEGKLTCLVIHPESQKRLLWDLFGGLLILIDIITIPMAGFPIDKSSVLRLISWTATIYWSTDMCTQFLCGYEHQGNILLDPRMTARHYLRTWFFIDAIVIGMDWFLILFLNMDSAASRSWHLGKSIRALRLIRSVRLVRVLKIVNLLHHLKDHVSSESTMMCLKVVYITMVAFLVSHYIGCYWYYLGEASFLEDIIGSRFSTTWLRESAHGADGADALHLYVISLHWAIGQAGLVPVNIFPSNDLELCYSVTVGILLLIVQALIVGKCTVWLLQLTKANRNYIMQETQIRKYLDLNNVSTKMTNTICRFFRLNFNQRVKRLHEDDILFFNHLSTRLRVKLHHKVYRPVLRKHHIFEYCERTERQCFWTICHMAMSEIYCPARGEVFVPGQKATHMYYSATGEMEYMAAIHQMRKISAGTWMCEVALWRPWVFAGMLVSITSSELVALSVDRFHQIIKETTMQTDFFKELQTYARDLVEAFDTPEHNVDIWDPQVAALAYTLWHRRHSRSMRSVLSRITHPHMWIGLADVTHFGSDVFGAVVGCIRLLRTSVTNILQGLRRRNMMEKSSS